MNRVQAVVLVLSMTLYASCQAGPKRGGRYNYYEDELLSNDVYGPEDPDSEARGGDRPLSRAINVNVVAKTPLEFRTNVKKKPKKKNLHTRRLMRKMGDDYNSFWMSIEGPERAGLEPRTVEMSSEQVAQLVEQVSNLQLEKELKEIAGLDQATSTAREGDGVQLEKMVSVFQQWLVKKSSCPVTYEWRDLGEYFWPRWIKTGSCSSSKGDQENDVSDESASYEDDYALEEEDSRTPSASSKASRGCSWPQGMNCVQGEVKHLHILRWHCRRRRSRKSKRSYSGGHHRGRKNHRCQWYKVPYPVTQSCKCSCQANQ